MAPVLFIAFFHLGWSKWEAKVDAVIEFEFTGQIVDPRFALHTGK